ncbi:UDP-N-acetylglucosamine 4,6-dehydratase family protein [Hydrogenimonas sp.]
MWLRPTFTKRILFFLAADIVISLFTLYMAYALRFNFSIPVLFLDHFWRVATPLILFKTGCFFFFKIYFKSWRYFGLQDFRQLALAHVAAYALFALLFFTFSSWFNPMPRSAIIIDFFLSLIFLGALRISKRLFLESQGSQKRKKALIVGVSPRTPQIIKSGISGDIAYFPEAIVANDEKLEGTYVENVRVYSSEKLPQLLENSDIEAALIAEPPEPRELDRLVEMLNSFGIRDIKMVSLLSNRNEKLQDIAIEDLLARKPKDLDIETIRSFVEEKTVLVTGAGGSIGSEICRQVLNFGAKELIMVDNAEYNLYQISDQVDSTRSVPKLVSILDRKKLEKLFETYRPQIVIHAAAYKHVPLCELNVTEAVENNLSGVMNVIDLSIAYGVRKVVNISSDKAVRPTNVMGATKRIGELYAQNVDSGKTEIVSVRFGNVLGSSGSVVPKFKAQIESGGPVTVTHPDITRYFMLIPEACQLVLQAAAIARGGEIFILDMGEPVKIVDLAKKMIRLYGKEKEVEIVFTGLRPGEKLFEELLIDDAECKTRYESIYVAKSTDYPIEKLKRDIEKLFESGNKRDALRRIVPEYLRRESDRLGKPREEGAKPL